MHQTGRPPVAARMRCSTQICPPRERVNRRTDCREFLAERFGPGVPDYKDQEEARRGSRESPAREIVSRGLPLRHQLSF